MNQSSIIDSVRARYIDEYLESAKKINYTDLTPDDGLVTVLYRDLPNTEIHGYPIASDFVGKNGETYTVKSYATLSEEDKKSCELRFYFLPYHHELYVGTTGSGKTTGCVEPQLRAISSQKNKPNLFLTDPKGEIFDRNAKHLQDQGYQTFVLNFKDLVHSDKWNPLLEVYDLKMSIDTIGTDYTMQQGKVRDDLMLAGDAEEFIDVYIEYQGKAFPSVAAFDKYVKFEKDYVEANIDGLINQLAHMMITVQSNQDKSWEYGAQDLLKGLIHCLLCEATDPKSGFTREMMNLRTLQQYYLSLRQHVLSDERKLIKHHLIKNKPKKVTALMATALDNAPNTMRSYCGVFDGAVKDWFQGHIFSLTSETTINLENNDKPFAIFLITRDYEKSDFMIAGLFIDWMYRQMLERAENKALQTRTFHFLLDEFGNIPAIKDLANKISTARSRNIWFHLVVQSYKQIDVVYGADNSVIIRDNCNSQIFLGAQNRDTKEIFSKECGKHYIPTLRSKLIPDDNSITEALLIPVSELDLIKPGQMYTKRLYMPVITSQFIRSYICAAQGSFKDFFNSNGLDTCTPISLRSYMDEAYTFARINQEDDFDEF